MAFAYAQDRVPEAHLQHSTLDPVADLFASCCDAMQRGVPAVKASPRDKEFFFQEWVRARLEETGRNYDAGGRNSYPDLTLVHDAQGYEVKGLAVPGRDRDYDCNSQVPTGVHNGRDVFYVFGRYPNGETGPEIPISDLVIVHGDFLNADHDYKHLNRSTRGFGTYGDLLLRDRKMYVAPTPYALLSGVVGRRTLVVPRGPDFDATRFTEVGTLVRVEVDEMLAGYSFDFETNALTGRWVPNPNAGRQHEFVAYRSAEEAPDPVALVSDAPLPPED